MSFKPQHFYHYILIIFAVIFASSSWFAYKDLRSNLKETIIIQPAHLVDGFNTHIDENKMGGLATLKIDQKNASTADFKINLPQQDKRVRTGVVEIELDKTKALWFNNMYIRTVRAVPFANNFVTNSFGNKSNQWLPLRPDNNTFRIPLYRDPKKSNIVLQLKYSQALEELPIKSIQIKPATFFDFPAGGLLISLGVIFITFFPGLFIALSNQKRNSLPLPILSFLLSLPISLGAFTICLITKIYSLFLPAAIFFTAIFTMAFKDKKLSFIDNAKAVLQNNKTDLNVWVMLLALVCLFCSFTYPAAVHNIHQGTLTKEHSFKAFRAHDSAFQFYNSKAIIEQDFDKYYANGRLVYKPQDREIFPGLSYAATTVFLQNIYGRNLSQTFFPYAVFFLISHVLMLNMLFAWFKRFNLKFAYTTVFFIPSIPVFWTLAMIGWFKLTGAALVLAGVYIIKENPKLLSHWILAGILFGLAKNYHGGNALILPLLTIWMLYLVYTRYQPISLKRLFTYFISLTAVTCACIYPWLWYIKIKWNTGSHLLFSQHFLDGSFRPNSLLQSIILFFKNNPIQEQIAVRWERTLNLFNIDQLTFIASQYGIHEGTPILGWLKFTTSFFLPAIAPYALFAIIIVLISRITIQRSNQTETKSDPWLDQFGWICFLNVIFLNFLSYGDTEEYPAITWETSTLLIVGILCHFIYWSCKHHKNGISIWLSAALFQLGILIAFG